MATKSKGDGEDRKRARKQPQEIGEPVVVSSTPIPSPRPPEPEALDVVHQPAATTTSGPDMWVKLLDQSPWTSKSPRTSDPVASPPITPRATRPQLKPDDNLMWAEQVWKTSKSAPVIVEEPVVVEPAAPSVESVEAPAPVQAEQASEPHVVQIDMDVPPVVADLEFKAPEPALPVQAEDVIAPPAVDEPVEPVAVVAEEMPSEPVLVEPIMVEPIVVEPVMVEEVEAPQPEAQPEPVAVNSPAMALLSTRLAELAAAQAAAAAAVAPVSEPEPEQAPAIIETAIEEPVVVEAAIEEPVAQDTPKEVVAPVALPLTPPPITPYFDRFASTTPPPPAAEAVAKPAAEAAKVEKEIPVEDLIGGVVSMVGTGVLGAFSLGSKAVTGLFRGGKNLGSKVVDEASKLGRGGCGTCGTSDKSCEK